LGPQHRFIHAFKGDPQMTSTVEVSSAPGRSGRVPDNDRGLFARLGQTVTAHPVRVFFGWLLMVAALIGISAVLGQPTPSRSAASELPAGYESARAQAVIDKAFGAPSRSATAFLVISRIDGGRLSAGDRALADGVAGRLARLEASHLTADRPTGLPLILTNGWPSTFSRR
jgi:hypothetical protein